MSINTSAKGILFALCTACLWGVLAIALKVSLNGLRPIEVAWMRFFVAFIVLAFYLLFFDRSSYAIFRRPPLILLVASLGLSINYFGFITGIEFTTPGIAQVFIQLGPVLLALTGFIFFKEKLNKVQLLGFVIVVAGLGLFYNEQFTFLFTQKVNLNRGVLWVIIGAVSWTVYAVSQKQLVKKHSPMKLNLAIFGFSALFLVPFVQFPAFTQISSGHWVLLVFLGLNTLAAYSFLSFALKYTEANKVSVIITLNPILTFIFLAILNYMEVSWIAYEYFSFFIVLGVMLVILGAVLVVVKKSERNKKEKM